MSEIRQNDENEDIVIIRIFDAPRKQIWNAWTEPELLKQWWGPKGFTCPFSQIDLRVGGSYLACMRSPEGQDFWSTGIYREIIENDRIVCTDAFSDPEGNQVLPSYYGMEGEWASELLVTITFETSDTGTKFTLQHTGIPAGTMREMTQLGWNESFDKLENIIRDNRL